MRDVDPPSELVHDHVSVALVTVPEFGPKEIRKRKQKRKLTVDP